MIENAQSPDRVTLSRNETESLCMKAARGAGFSWGMAEEAGFATGWLAEHGIDGAAALLRMFTRTQGRSLVSGTPRPMPGHWHSTDNGPLCPIQLGAALTDHALLADSPFSRETQLDPVETPVLLLPFLVRAAMISQKSFGVDWPQDSLQITPDGAFDRLAADAWTDKLVLAVKIKPLAKPGTGIMPPEPSRLPSILVSTLNGLGTLALKTTVPATHASRTGAGSSTSDND